MTPQTFIGNVVRFTKVRPMFIYICFLNVFHRNEETRENKIINFSFAVFVINKKYL